MKRDPPKNICIRLLLIIHENARKPRIKGKYSSDQSSRAIAADVRDKEAKQHKRLKTQGAMESLNEIYLVLCAKRKTSNQLVTEQST